MGAKLLAHPLKNRSLIWFTAWSGLVHGRIMAVRAVQMPAERGHLLGDIPALVIVAVVLAVPTPRGAVDSAAAAAA